jgi:hypothetical protein
MCIIKSIIKFIEAENNITTKKLLIPVLLNEINIVFSSIKNCVSIDEAGLFFDLLQEAQNCICGMIFIDDIDVCDSLWKFFTDFDRIDNAGERIRKFEAIKFKNYKLI